MGNRLFLTVAVLWLGHFLVDMMLGIWPIYKTMVNLDLAWAGLIGGACAFAGEGMQIIFGSLSDRGYRTSLIVIGLLATVASAFLMYTESYTAVFLLCLITCLGSGAFHPSATSMMGNLPSPRKGLLIGLFASGGMLGMALSQLIFTQTHAWFEGHVAWLAIPVLILAGCVAFSQLEAKSAPSTEPRKHVDFKLFATFFKRSDLRALYFSQVCNAALFWGTMFLLPDMLLSRGYDSWITFGGGHMALILGGAVMMVPAGYLADRYSSRSVILSATAISMGLFYTMFLLPSMDAHVLLGLLFVMGAMLGVVNPVSVALGTRLVPEHKGMVSAFLMGMVWCVSESIGQCGGGLLTRCFSDDAPAKALAVLGVLYVVGFAMASLLPQETAQESEAEYA